jgi:transcriptional regulator GlxA family with amidase domain
VTDLAVRSAMSPRTFARRFRETAGTTPYRWLLQQRIFLAQRLLETTDLSVDAVASQCGIGDAANLRDHFRRVVGTSPNSYRQTFRHIAS